MKQFFVGAGLAALCGLSVAAPISQIVGDMDNYGGTVFTSLDIPQDQRSPGEAAATDGSQQTDFYTVLFNPLPQSFSMTFAFGAPVTSLSLGYRAFGLQAQTFSPLTVDANGIDVSSLFNFQDGPLADVTHVLPFDAGVLAAINGAGNTLTLTVSRGASVDALAFDYFQVTGETASTVPEPAGLALVALALAAAGGARRAAQRKD